MKNGLHYILFFLGVISLLVSCTRTLSNSNESHLPARFVADSGYILKKEGISILLKIEINDTIDTNYSTLKDTDTIGKYYKTEKGNYLACVLDIIHPIRNASPVLIEYTMDGKIINDENYYGGMYLSCWKNNYEGFKKQGDYYSVKNCGTGSGFYSENIYFFKELEPQGNSVPATAWSSFCLYQAEEKPLLACNITSVISIKSDTVFVHYKLETLEPDESEDVNYKVINTEFFDIKYIKRETGWEALDTLNLSRIPM